MWLVLLNLSLNSGDVFACYGSYDARFESWLVCKICEQVICRFESWLNELKADMGMYTHAHSLRRSSMA